MTLQGAEALAIAALTLIGVFLRPGRLNEGGAALIGAALVLLAGLVSLPRAVHVELADWNVFLFFLGMMGVAALADQSGVFDRIASLAAHLARGSVLLLYLAVMVTGTIIAVLFANDSAALVLTPIVYALVLRLRLDPLPFVFATTFIADSASLLLPVSNPLNIIVADHFHLVLADYLRHMALPALVAVVVNVAVFLLLFRRRIRGRFHTAEVPPMTSSDRGPLIILGVLAIAYLAASAAQFPLGIVAVIGAALMAIYLHRTHILNLSRAASEISWTIFAFLGGMLIVVDGLRSAGITSALGRALLAASGSSPLQTAGVTVIGTALGSNLINNLPMALVMVSALPSLHLAASARTAAVYGTIIGCDLGPNLTHLGSLATFLWLFFLRRKGLTVSPLEYIRYGVVVTPLMLGGAILALWLTL